MATDIEPVAGTLLDLLTALPDDRTAIVVPETGLRLTGRALHQQVVRLAAQLADAGIGRGDRIGLSLPNGLAGVVSFLAAATAGTAAPLNPAYSEDEVRFYLDDTEATLLLAPPDGAEAARAAAASRGVRVVAVDVDAQGDVVAAGLSSSDTPPPVVSADDVALILHTSGSTGRPKRVPLTHANLMTSARNVARSYALGPDDISLCVMPLFHVHGLVASTLAPLASGGAVVVPAKFSPLAFWRMVRDYGVTWYSAVPTIHQLLLARAERSGVRPEGAEHLRFIRSCSSALSPQLMAGLEAAFGVPVVEAYGMTEAAHQMTTNPLPPADRRPGSVGRGTDVRIGIMDEHGTHLPIGERGEVVIQGPNVTSGYDGNPDANASSFTDGWFRTGDQGMLDASGYLTLTGRLKEMINRGGEKISPREIDEVLASHPDVAEAVCFGVPHPSWGEDVEAAVVLADGASVSAADLIAWCRTKLADYKCPKRIHVGDAMPRTATGKIQRRLVAEVYGPRAS